MNISLFGTSVKFGRSNDEDQLFQDVCRIKYEIKVFSIDSQHHWTYWDDLGIKLDLIWHDKFICVKMSAILNSNSQYSVIIRLECFCMSKLFLSKLIFFLSLYTSTSSLAV